jgi:hypothetical protein
MAQISSQSVPVIVRGDENDMLEQPEKLDWYQAGVAALRILLLQDTLEESLEPTKLVSDPARISTIQDKLQGVWDKEIVPAEAAALAGTLARLLTAVSKTGASWISVGTCMHACH